MTRTTRILAAAAALTLLPTAAFAAPGGKSGGGGGKDGGGKGGKGSLVVEDGVYGGTASATISDPKSDTWLEATCYQDGVPVIYYRDVFDPAGQMEIQLGPTPGYEVGMGGADCVANAKYWNLKRQRWVPVASSTFLVTD